MKGFVSFSICVNHFAKPCKMKFIETLDVKHGKNDAHTEHNALLRPLEKRFNAIIPTSGGAAHLCG